MYCFCNCFCEIPAGAITLSPLQPAKTIVKTTVEKNIIYFMRIFVTDGKVNELLGYENVTVSVVNVLDLKRKISFTGIKI